MRLKGRYKMPLQWKVLPVFQQMSTAYTVSANGEVC